MGEGEYAMAAVGWLEDNRIRTLFKLEGFYNFSSVQMEMRSTSGTAQFEQRLQTCQRANHHATVLSSTPHGDMVSLSRSLLSIAVQGQVFALTRTHLNKQSTHKPHPVYSYLHPIDQLHVAAVSHACSHAQVPSRPCSGK